jgi:hypothetical protein
MVRSASAACRRVSIWIGRLRLELDRWHNSLHLSLAEPGGLEMKLVCLIDFFLMLAGKLLNLLIRKKSYTKEIKKRKKKHDPQRDMPQPGSKRKEAPAFDVESFFSLLFLTNAVLF